VFVSLKAVDAKSEGKEEVFNKVPRHPLQPYIAEHEGWREEERKKQQHAATHILAGKWCLFPVLLCCVMLPFLFLF
jgi:hypothetical protein